MDQEFDETVYSTQSVDRLILLAARRILRNEETCTFERLVKECFILFPRSFSLYRYPEWPDSNKLDRPLRTLREKGWITGNPGTGFSLTNVGEGMAIDVERQLHGEKRRGRTPQRGLKGQERVFINFLTESDIYKRFLKDQDEFTLTEAEFRALLRCTLETPVSVVKQNLVSAKNIAMDSGEEKVIDFLRVCGQKIPLDS